MWGVDGLIDMELRSQRLVTDHREGRNIYYRLADHHVINLYSEVAAHPEEHC
jgi:ArsR family transcriptional regulator, lead/cadmium/zinc/bismuth-responsive transcriptional repressor